MSVPTEQLSTLGRLERRDWQLWTLALLLIFVLTSTVLMDRGPQAVGEGAKPGLQLKLYTVGLSVLVLLFCGYIVQSVSSLKKLRRELSRSELEKMEITTLLEVVEERSRKVEISEASYRSLLESSVDAVVVVDPDHIVQFSNPAMEELFGTKSGLVGQVFPCLLSPGETMEIDVTRADDVKVVAEVRVIDTSWDGERALLASLRDVTIRKQAEETLRQANDELKRLDQMKSDFLSAVSHELRTPLTSIKSAVQLLESGRTGCVNDDQKKFLEMARRNIDRLSAMVNDVLDLSKIEAGQMPFKLREVDLGSLMEHVVATFRPQADSRSLTLSLARPETIPAAYGDAARIEQVLCNLLSNAVKFTEADGQVTVSLKVVAANIEVSVIDTGRGIAKADQERVFDHFYQAQDVAARSTKGTGLGLAITKKLVEAYGGEIGLSSDPGHGSRFYFTIPVFSPMAAELADLELELRQGQIGDYFSLLLVVPHPQDTGVWKESEAEAPGGLPGVASVIGTVLRAHDRVVEQKANGRFIVLLRQVPAKGALIVRDKVAATLAKTAIVYQGKRIATPSVIGPSTCPEDGKTAKDLVTAAQRVVEKQEVPWQTERSL